MIEKEISIFAAYKFKSKYYKLEVLEAAIKNAIANTEKKLQKKFKGIKLKFLEQNEISSGENVKDFVIKNVEKATLNIFELSDREPNVTFELGYSMGISKQKYDEKCYDVLLQCKKRSHRDVISDLLGQFITMYPGNRNQSKLQHAIQSAIENELLNKINKILQNDRFIKNLLWRVQGEKVYIVCPHIPIKDQKKYGVISAFSRYGDFNTVYELGMFLKSSLNCEVEHIDTEQANSTKKLFENNLIFVGGPMWNKFAESLMASYALPYKYVWSPDEKKEDYIFDTLANKKYYKKIFQSNKTICKDYGIYAMLPNPCNSEKVVILISGITSFGGNGAARAFIDGNMSSENCKFIIKKIGFNDFFACIVEVEILSGEFPYPKKISAADVAQFNPSARSWSKI